MCHIFPHEAYDHWKTTPPKEVGCEFCICEDRRKPNEVTNEDDEIISHCRCGCHIDKGVH